MYRADVQGAGGDTVLVTFTPLKIYDVNANVVRGGLLAQIGELFDIPRQKMEEKLKRGFTVSMNTQFERQTYLGLGEPRELPPKPWIPPEGAQALLNDRISLCQKSRHFLGPFKAMQGETLQWALKTNSQVRTVVNAYVVADGHAKEMRDAYIDPSRAAKNTYPVLIRNEKFESWQQSMVLQTDGVFWFIVEPHQVQGEVHVNVFIGSNK